MSEYFITGPGGATNNSMKKEAKNLIKGTVSKSYFKSTWKKRNQKQNYAAWNENGKMILDPDGYRILISDLKIRA